MPDWDSDSPTLEENLRQVLREIRDSARRRDLPGVEAARRWQSRMMQNLDVPQAAYVGAFRGEAGLEKVQVHVNGRFGVNAAEVAADLARFEQVLQSAIRRLDELIPSGSEPDADQIGAILDVCAWTHAQWVRIHPFANGNGRSARLWANCIAMRYLLPPFVRLHPRPERGYGVAGASAMLGDWGPTAVVFRRLYIEFVNATGPT